MAMAWMDGNLYRHEREHASITSKHIIIFIDFMLEIDTIIIRWEILSDRKSTRLNSSHPV